MNRKKNKGSDHAPEGWRKKKKGHSSGHSEKKVARLEDTSDPFPATPETLSLHTKEVVAAYNGVIPFSRYASDTRLW